MAHHAPEAARFVKAQAPASAAEAAHGASSWSAIAVVIVVAVQLAWVAALGWAAFAVLR
jgi:hypothetical protein